MMLIVGNFFTYKFRAGMRYVAPMIVPCCSSTASVASIHEFGWLCWWRNVIIAILRNSQHFTYRRNGWRVQWECWELYKTALRGSSAFSLPLSVPRIRFPNITSYPDVNSAISRINRSSTPLHLYAIIDFNQCTFYLLIEINRRFTI